jgi:hypothetical protein
VISSIIEASMKKSRLAPSKNLAGLALLVLACDGGKPTTPLAPVTECVNAIEAVAVIDGVIGLESLAWHDGKLYFL